MNQADIIRLYLDGIKSSMRMVSELICNSDKADIIAGLAVIILNAEDQAENDILDFELDFHESELVKECRSSLLESDRAFIVCLEKIQFQDYHFEELIHSLKLEDETLSKEIYFG